MLRFILRLYRRLKDANSHYSLFNNVFLVVIFTLGLSGASGSLMGYLVSRATSFWDAYGWPGTLAAGFGAALIVALVGTFLLLMIELARFNRLRTLSPAAGVPAPGENPVLDAQPGSDHTPERAIAGGHFALVQLPPDQNGALICTFHAVANRASVSVAAYIEVNRARGGLILRKLRVAEIGRVERGETVRVPILSVARPTPDGRMGFHAWFGDRDRDPDGLAHPLVVQREMARLILVYADGFAESRFFILEWSRAEERDSPQPTITDEGLFGIVTAWERASAKA